jgi:hypothetical protein
MPMMYGGLRQLTPTSTHETATDARPSTSPPFRAHSESARALLAAGADPDILDSQRYDAVTIVAVREDVPTHKVLLSGGASAKLPDRQGVTPLDHARHRGYTSIVRIL